MRRVICIIPKDSLKFQDTSYTHTKRKFRISCQLDDRAVTNVCTIRVQRSDHNRILT